MIEPHLSPPDPIQLKYTIRVDPDHTNVKPTIYELPVSTPFPFEVMIRRVLAPHPAKMFDLREIERHNRDIAAIVQQMKVTLTKHKFYTAFTKDPVGTLEKYVSSQQRDLEIIFGDERVGSGREWLGDEFRRGGKDGFWGSEAVRESVGLMVAKPPRGG